MSKTTKGWGIEVAFPHYRGIPEVPVDVYSESEESGLVWLTVAWYVGEFVDKLVGQQSPVGLDQHRVRIIAARQRSQVVNVLIFAYTNLYDAQHWSTFVSTYGKQTKRLTDIFGSHLNITKENARNGLPNNPVEVVYVNSFERKLLLFLFSV